MKSHSLQLVDFIDKDGVYTTGLVPVGNVSNTLDLKTDEKAVLLEAELFKHIDFVFFRRFSRWSVLSNSGLCR